MALSLSISGLSGCKEPTPEPKERTEPWKKEGEDDGPPEKAPRASFRVAEGQLLQFELPGRKARPAGALGGVTGEVAVNLRALQFVSGELHFDLGELRMSPGKRKKGRGKKKLDPALEEATPDDWTATAMNWLGLGPGARAPEEHHKATFFIESARELSHASAASGARKKSKDGDPPGPMRQVYATAVGRLEMRGLSVKRSVPLLVRFYYPPKKEGEKVEGAKQPHTIEVVLRSNVRVPLAEYEIKPRDEAGHVVQEDMDLLGREVGSTARIEGSLLLENLDHPPPSPAADE